MNQALKPPYYFDVRGESIDGVMAYRGNMIGTREKANREEK
jgi:hypothetical protein